MTCGVGCQFGFNPSKSPDATFGFPQQGGTASVLRSMESASYYSENNIAHARRMGFNVVMTASLSSDVPVGYFSWAEYNIMAPVQPKTEKALAVAFISNCGAHNFRLQALNVLEKLIKIGFYGSCHRNHDGKRANGVGKPLVLLSYFSVAANRAFVSWPYSKVKRHNSSRIKGGLFLVVVTLSQKPKGQLSVRLSQFSWSLPLEKSNSTSLSSF
ncbi:hypothetical protein SADUNF_Sadunf04G0104200 [Salix dunnii]|uniref:Uncharacterized protein n=1 Tax=Salix dunnii TaxID=1413687 RepID=A0A835N0V8_9ROSI|nr:hypothetical protein SADUNF_Sadunf04G0104200 [Salix dunnii]